MVSLRGVKVARVGTSIHWLSSRGHTGSLLSPSWVVVGGWAMRRMLVCSWDCWGVVAAGSQVSFCTLEIDALPPSECSPAQGHRALANGAQAVFQYVPLGRAFEQCTTCTVIHDCPVGMRALQLVALCFLVGGP